MSEKFPSKPPEPVRDSERPTIPVPRNPFEAKERPGLNISSASFEKFNRTPKAESRTNEDAWMAMEDSDGRGCTAMVADGMGAYPGADRASRSIVDTVAQRNDRLTGIHDGSEGVRVVRSLLREANARLVVDRTSLPEEERYMGRMGTTGVLARVFEKPDGKREVVIGHAGDSRAWIRYADGHLECQTLDMHPVLRAIRQRSGFVDARNAQSIFDNLESHDQYVWLKGLLQTGQEWPPQLVIRKEEINFLDTVVGDVLVKMYFAHREVVDGAFGYAPPIDVICSPLPDGASVLLTTDGIHDNLMRFEMEALLRGERGHMDEDVWMASRTGQTPAEILAKAAYSRALDFSNPRSKGIDDITAVMIETSKR